MTNLKKPDWITRQVYAMQAPAGRLKAGDGRDWQIVKLLPYMARDTLYHETVKDPLTTDR
jgi:hypothetical protein